MKIILFGTGDYYNKYKDWFDSEDIVCLLDNNEQKQGTVLGGKIVKSPSTVLSLEFDIICILSVYYDEIKEQLLELGVAKEHIIHCSELHNYPQFIRTDRMMQIIDKEGNSVSEIYNVSTSVLLMSHDLDYNGATLALFYVACILKEKGYDVWFASWTDGKLKTLLKKMGISVIIEPRLQIETFRSIEWIKNFYFIFCNTLLYYKLLADRDYSKKYIWWLHEPEVFYQSVDKEVLSSVKADNLKIYAVGEKACSPFRKYCPHLEVRELLYGIPDVVLEKNIKEDDSIFEIITVGTVQEYKGQDVLVQAVLKLPEVYQKKVHISIVGGVESVYYNSVIEAAKDLQEIIDFVPPVSRADIHKYYDKADIYVCPSRQDSMPVVVAESMMYSVPPIVSDSTGIAPFVKDGESGWLFSNENSSELSEKIKWCMDHRHMLSSMGNCAREQYDKYFSIESLEKNIRKILECDWGI